MGFFIFGVGNIRSFSIQFLYPICTLWTLMPFASFEDAISTNQFHDVSVASYMSHLGPPEGDTFYRPLDHKLCTYSRTYSLTWPVVRMNGKIVFCSVTGDVRSLLQRPTPSTWTTYKTVSSVVSKNIGNFITIMPACIGRLVLIAS